MLESSKMMGLLAFRCVFYKDKKKIRLLGGTLLKKYLSADQFSGKLYFYFHNEIILFNSCQLNPNFFITQEQNFVKTL